MLVPVLNHAEFHYITDGRLAAGGGRHHRGGALRYPGSPEYHGVARGNGEIPPPWHVEPRVVTKAPDAAHAHVPGGTIRAIGYDAPGHMAKWCGYVRHPRAGTHTTRRAPGHSDTRNPAGGWRHNCGLRSTGSSYSDSLHHKLHWSASAHTCSRTTIRPGACVAGHWPPASWKGPPSPDAQRAAQPD